MLTSVVASNHIPWIIIGICYVICPVLLIAIRYMLARENRKRDAEPVDEKYDDVYIEVVLPDWTRTERRVDKVRVSLSLARASIAPRSCGAVRMLTAFLSLSRNSWILLTGRIGTSDMCCDDRLRRLYM